MDSPLLHGQVRRGYAEAMAKDGKNARNLEPRINNRRALHDYFIEAKVECGMALLGTEVKSLREGKAQLNDSFARVEGTRLVLHNCHIDPYTKSAIVYNHDPVRERILLVHKRELKKLADESSERGVTLIPLAIYFKEGRAKLELGVAKGKKQHDKRDSIKRKEMDRDLRRAMTQKH